MATLTTTMTDSAVEPQAKRAASTVKASTLRQTLVVNPAVGNLEIQYVQYSNVDDKPIGKTGVAKMFQHSPVAGVAASYLDNGRIDRLAISTMEKCIVVKFHNQGRRPDGSNPPALEPAEQVRVAAWSTALQSLILCRNSGVLLGFDLAPLAMSLYRAHGIRLANGVDIQSFLALEDPGDRDRRPLHAIQTLLGEADMKIHTDNIAYAFRNATQRAGLTVQQLVQRAWMAQFLYTYQNGASTLDPVKRIDTNSMPNTTLDFIAKVSLDKVQQNIRRPALATRAIVANTSKSHADDGSIDVESARYKDHLRTNPDSSVNVLLNSNHGPITVPASIAFVEGRIANLNTSATEGLITTNKQIVRLTTVGPDGPTLAETRREAAVLSMLQNPSDIAGENPWINTLWFSTSAASLVWPQEWSSSSSSRPIYDSKNANAILGKLNPSQKAAVETMLSQNDSDRFTVIQGPPGTGKTSVIAAYVQTVMTETTGRPGIWIVAQSNVAVKNVAEKLIKVGFTAFKLLVSRDFYVDWHEHLYNAGVQPQVIVSDRFRYTKPNDLRDTSVILCTLSMLSSDQLKKFTIKVPIQTLVVDEASQIEIGDYIPAFQRYSSLRKMCFIGDDKQLPPFGADEQEDLMSIFEVTHLRSTAHFLDTQYRMPPQIGDFISGAVYDGQLKSWDNHPVQGLNTTACYFVDVSGQETRERGADSIQNNAEAAAAMILSRYLQDNNLSHRIITPYDLQRNLLEQKLQEEGLEWKDKCFNVDSFQGNEEEYIIISLVRSQALGFLNKLRRTNVMLTRCKRGMFVLTGKTFIQGKGKDSLVGVLAEHAGSNAWLSIEDLRKGDFL